MFAAAWLGPGTAFGQYGMRAPSQQHAQQDNRRQAEQQEIINDIGIIGGLIGGEIEREQRRQRQDRPLDFVPPQLRNNTPQYIPQRPQYIPQQPQYIPQQPQYIPQQPQYIPQQPQNVFVPANRLPANRLPTPQNSAVTQNALPKRVSQIPPNQLALADYSLDRAKQKLQTIQRQQVDDLAHDVNRALKSRLNNQGRMALDAAVAQTLQSGDTTNFENQIAAANAAGDTQLAKALDASKRLAETKYEIANGQISPDAVKAEMPKIQQDLQDGFPPSPGLTDVLNQADSISNLSDAMDELAKADNGGSGGLDVLNGLNNGNNPGVVMILSDAIGLPIVPGVDPTGDVPPPDAGGVVGDSGGVVIMNPAETGGPIAYRVDDQDFTTESGYWQEVPVGDGGTVLITFDRGGNFGTARYSLSPGTSTFKLTDRGWDIVARKPFTLVIDNSAFGADFNYLLDGRPFVVRAGRKGQHTSRYPMTVQFDRGDGGEPARKELLSGTYKVAVDLGEKRIDLYETGAPTGLASAGRAPSPSPE